MSERNCSYCQQGRKPYLTKIGGVEKWAHEGGVLCQDPLPTIQEMSGLVEDFTDGKSLKEYMDELSDE